jgi:hypothetical protein
MRQPQRSQPPRSARLSSSALSSTTLPEVLEHSTLRRSDIEQSTEGISGEGFLVKLFPVSPKNMPSVSGSKRTLYIVGSPNANSAFPSNRESAQKFRGKTTQSARGGSLYERRAKANVTNGKAKGQRLLARGKRKRLTSDERGRGDDVEPDDTSDEGEEGAESENDEEVEEGGDGGEEEEEEEECEAEEGEAVDTEAEEKEGEEEGGTENYNAAKDVTTERNAVEDLENVDDAEEQDDDRNDGELDEAQAKEADKRKDRDDLGEEDTEKDAQNEEERVKEAGGSGDMVEKPSETKAKDDADKDEQADGNGDDKEAEEETGNHNEVREETESMEQRVTANDCDGARGDCRLADIADKEGEGRNTGSGGDERMAGEDDGDPEERRKRPLETCEPFDCPTPGDRPNKRSKSDDSESDDDAATDDSPKRTVNLETTPRPRTPSPTSTTASPGSILEIVRQTSGVPGLENTEKAVWDAAQRDSIISSLPVKEQAQMVRTALSLGSEEGVKELKRFVSNARTNGKLGSESLVSEFKLITFDPDSTSRLASNALVPQSACLAYLSTIYRRLDVLESKETLFTITKRANLAAMSQYRESLVPKGVGGNRARDANLKIFRVIFPDHSTVQRPEDKAANPAASQDWTRLRNRLQEGRAWLEVRNHFGGDGAFLALPPQCVPDSHVSKIPARSFGPLLGLLDVAWRALDDRARRTMDALVRLALAGQPLPGASLALERPELGSSAAQAGLSPMLAGWTVSDCDARSIEDVAVANVTERRVRGEVIMQGAARTITTEISGEEIVTNAESSVRKDKMMGVDDGLFENIDFDEHLSQQI